MPSVRLALDWLALFLALAAFLACGRGGEPLLTMVFTNATGAPVDLLIEIADTPEMRQRGLMFRDHLAEDQGMLFDFRGETGTGFWMKDTSIPLSIAFISAQGLILDIQDMLPFSTDLHQSDQPYAFALEVNQGWFERNDIGVGDSVQLPPRQGDGDR